MSTTRNQLKEYLFLWSGQTISRLTSSVASFVIIWWITIETQSGLMLSLAAFANYVPYMLVTPFAGVFVDRWNRKLIIAISDAVEAIFTLVLVVLFYLSIVQIWHILVIAAIRGLFQAFHEISMQSIIPLMVPKDQLSRINGMEYLSYGLLQLVGPVLAALLLAIWQIKQILIIDPIGFIFAIIPLLLVKIPEINQPDKNVTGETTTELKKGYKEEFMEGVNFLRNGPGLMALLGTFAIINILGMPSQILLPLFVADIHQGTASILASFMVALSVGGISSAVIMSIWKGFSNKSVGIALGIIFSGTGMIIVGFSPYQFYPMIIVGMVLMGVSSPLLNVSARAIWQTVIPDAMMGRVFSVRMTIAHTLTPFAMVLAGFLSEFIPVDILITGAGFLTVLAISVSWIISNISRIEKLHDINQSDFVPKDQIVQAERAKIQNLRNLGTKKIADTNPSIEQEPLLEKEMPHKHEIDGENT